MSQQLKTGFVDERHYEELGDEVDAARKRPNIIFGSADDRGAEHGVKEVVTNSIDEAREGYGTTIRLSLEEPTEEDIAKGADPSTYVAEVEDDGRGLPMDWDEKVKKYRWYQALCTQYASGKVGANSQYAQSAGLNGVGLCTCQYTSSFMDVYATYGGQTRHVHFRKGRPVTELQYCDPIKEGTGTKIRFQPDPEVFLNLKSVKLDADRFITMLVSQALLNGGVKFIFEHAELSEPRVFHYDGPNDFIDKLLQGDGMLNKSALYTDEVMGTDSPDFEDYKLNMRLALNFSRKVNLIQIYHNSSHLTEGGSSVAGFERGMANAFTEYARANGKITKSDKILYRDIETLLVCIANTDCPGDRTLWGGGQTKKSIINTFIGSSFSDFIKNKVKYWLDTNKQDADKVLYEVLINKRAREEGSEVSKKILKKLTKTVSFGSKPKNFKDCSSKKISERELYIVEGNSALGSVKLACNPKFQAAMTLRGKPINCLKNKITQSLNNDIITDLYRVFGCGMEIKSKYIEDIPKFDINKLNWGKIIICTDADVDGHHIKTLLLAMFYKLSPSLLRSGRVYIVETPLYELNWKKETRFAYDESERVKYTEELKALGAKDGQIKISRSKGLGENSAEMMAKTTMNPATRRLTQIKFPEETEGLAHTFEALLGDDLETRKIIIDSYFDKVATSEDSINYE